MTEHIQCQVSTEAKDVLLNYQRQHKIRQQGAALESMLVKFGAHETAMRKEAANHIDELVED